ncbi:MAG: hypothetical protein ACJAQ3_001354, partial [Planctomycetota bacterium]
MLTLLLLAAATAVQEPTWAAPPISYGTRSPTDAVAQLDARIAAGEATLRPA